MLSFLLTNVLHSNVLLPRRADEKGGSALSGPRHRRRIDWGGRRGTGRSGNPAVLLARWLFFFVVAVVAGQQHPRQFPERRRLQARHFRFDLWKNTEDLEARNEKIAAPQQFKNLSVGFGRDSWHPEFSAITGVNRCVSLTDLGEVRVSVKWVNFPHVLNLNFSSK